MKKYLTLLIAFWLIAPETNAQQTHAREWRLMTRVTRLPYGGLSGAYFYQVNNRLDMGLQFGWFGNLLPGWKQKKDVFANDIQVWPEKYNAFKLRGSVNLDVMWQWRMTKNAGANWILGAGYSIRLDTHHRYQSFSKPSTGWIFYPPTLYRVFYHGLLITNSTVIPLGKRTGLCLSGLSGLYRNRSHGYRPFLAADGGISWRF
jgi:hypothetical protein